MSKKDTSPKSMTSNNKKNKPTTKEQKKDEQRKDEKKKSYGDGNDDDIDVDEDEIELTSDEDDEEENKKIIKNKKNWSKFISKMYPSKYASKKAKAAAAAAAEEDDDDSESEEEVIVTKKKSKKNAKKKYRKEESSSSEDDEDEDEEYEEESRTLRNGKKFNIIFTIGANGLEDEEEYDEEDYDDEEEYWDEEDESDEEDEESEEESDDESDEDEDNEKQKTKKMTEEELEKEISVAKQSRDQLLHLSKSNEGLAFYKEMIEKVDQQIKVYQKQQNKLSHKAKGKNTKTFIDNLRNKNVMNDVEFFRKLTVKEQKKILEHMEEVNKICKLEKPYRLTLLEADIPPQFKASAIKKINMLRNMEPGSGEFYKIKNWVDTFMKIPFNKYNNMTVHKEDGVEKCSEFLETAKTNLDTAVYGMDDAKMQIMQFVGQWMSNPNATGTALAIKGPMGTGKTTLVKEGISKILGREFAFIALGGATDSSFLEGHSYTYEGAIWGQIVEILIRCQSMNPVIYFDELDKVSDTPKGEEIIGILTHLTDTSQNSQFHDKYFAEIDFDLSRALFIFSYNDESKVNPILRDRMYRIQVAGYDKKQKQIISTRHLMPKIREQVAFGDDDVIIPQETIDYLVQEYTNKEEGVRNLKRCLEIIHTKLNLYRLMKPDTDLFGKTNTMKVEFPFTVTKEVVGKLIKREEDSSAAIIRTMYV